MIFQIFQILLNTHFLPWNGHIRTNDNILKSPLYIISHHTLPIIATVEEIIVIINGLISKMQKLVAILFLHLSSVFNRLLDTWFQPNEKPTNLKKISPRLSILFAKNQNSFKSLTTDIFMNSSNSHDWRVPFLIRFLT